MIKTEFMDLYEALSILNEDVQGNFEKTLVPKIKALKPKLDKAIKALDNPNYVEIQEILKSLINGFEVCFKVSKQIAAINPQDQIINAPFDEAIGILNKIEDIVFRVEQGDSALDKYLKDQPSAWTVEELRDALKGYEKYSDIDISTLSVSAEKPNIKPEVTQQTATQSAESKNVKLNRARQNNLKIVKAFKEVGLPADDLTVTAKNKKGKDYKKASDKLNKLRKTLFGEALDDENIFNQDF